MATVKVTSTTGIDFDDYKLVHPADGAVTTHTPTKWHIDYKDGTAVDYAGKGLKYDGSFNLTAGAITGFTFTESKTEKFQVTGLTVVDAADLNGAADGKTFLALALAGDDKITGGNGGDHILGFDGDDTIDGGKGADTLEGGAGNDTYVLDDKNDSITDSSGTSDTAKIGTADIKAAFTGVENYIFTGKGAWTFTGNNLGDSITGGAADDTLSGGTGNDRLDGGKGIDTLSGGTGNDTYVIDNVAELAAGKIIDTGGTDTLIGSVLLTAITGIENYSYTGKAAWTLSFNGDGTAHVLTGGGGIDTFTGGTKADTLSGNAGNDVLDGKGGGDTMDGGAGNDTYFVDSASDDVIEAAKGGSDTIKATLATVNLVTLFGTNEIENLIADATVVTAIYTGNDLKNVIDTSAATGSATLDGGIGDDTLKGGAGDDKLTGGDGKDAMSGGGGNDVYFLDNAGDKVTELPGQGDHDKIVSTVLVKAVVANVEDYTYTGGADWSFTGTTGDNTLIGGTGNDTLNGNGGKDSLDGGAGNDIYLIDSADDTANDSGGGIDTAKVATNAIKSAANFTGVEAFIFTGKGDWEFTGNTLNNAITGGVGNDTLGGGDGNDVLDGGKGEDKLAGGKGDDTYLVDSLKDTVTETSGTDTVKTSVAIADATGFSGVENFTFTGKGNWTFTGDPGSNVIQGGAGSDTLDGGDGDDTAVFAGKRTDYKIDIGLDGIVTVKDMNGATNGADGTDTLTHFEHLKFSDGTIDLETTVLLSARSQAFTGNVASIGDVNGDGSADFVVGATSDDGGASGSGAAYIIYGKAAGLPESIDLAALGSAGVKLSGPNAGGSTGLSVHSAGDVNGDGLDDVIIGAPGEDGSVAGSGVAFVVFGSASLPADIDLGTLNGTNGFSLNGASSGMPAGSAVAAGDINGDGFSDLIVNSFYPSFGSAAAGTTYVVFGHDGPFDSEFDLSSVNGTNGISLNGRLYDLSGFSVASAGDVNGDGIDDLFIGAVGGAVAKGELYVVFGHTGLFTSPIPLSGLNGTNGFEITGAKTFDGAGYSVSASGDINGDGFDDIIVGAAGADSKGDYTGAAYVIFGHNDPFGQSLSLSSLNGKNGFKIAGLAKYDYAGESVSIVGDVNGDGYADVLVGAPGDPYNNNSGSAYLIFGHAGSFAASLDVSKLTLGQGIAFHDLDPTHGAGAGVSGAGDVNGDGYDDLLIGIPGADAAGAGAVSTVVIYGGNFNLASTSLIQGTSGNDTKAGTGAAEVIIGAQGNDTLNGGGGHDVIQGGSGNDHVSVTDNTFNHVDGGGGTDTLSLDYGGVIDFANLDGNAATSDRGKISGIEVIDVDNGQNNAMTLHLADVIDIAPQNQNVGGVAALDNVLLIEGNAGDTLALSTADGWGSKVSGTLAGYDLYTSHGVTIGIDTDISVSVS